MNRRMNLGSWMIAVCLFSGVGVEARQETLSKDKSAGQSQRSVASDREVPRVADPMPDPPRTWPCPVW